MFNLILFEPEIPPNTGNVIRLCANTGAQLHLIRPLGFDLDDKQLRRAGLDYHEYAKLQVHDNLEECLKLLPNSRLFALSTKATHAFHQTVFQSGDAFLFGPESRGLPASILGALPAQQVLRLPMLPNNRSLNLSNTVAITVYEAWRQIGFLGSQSTR